LTGLTVEALASRLGAELRGRGEGRLQSVASLSTAGPDQLAFLANPRYRQHLAATRAGAVILTESAAADCPVPALISANPYADYARAAALLCPPRSEPPGIDPAAAVAEGASLGRDVSIAATAVVETGAVLGDRVVLGPGAVVRAGCRVGDDSRLGSRVVLEPGVSLGRRCILHGGVVIGGDGFGFAPENGRWVKVPQLGGVRIGDDVEIGANSTVDRGAIDDTVIEDGVKLDNQVQVAHNVWIGAHTAIAGCTAIAGSTRIGRACAIAGGVGIAGHIEIADGTVITAMTLVTRSIRQPGTTWSGSLPMDDNRSWRRNSARFRQLDDISRRLADLEKRLAAMDSNNNKGNSQ
jgi:UDP-3-O-[3-hydroxymyristoyl] glucosamine N-acyltransferase